MTHPIYRGSPRPKNLESYSDRRGTKTRCVHIVLYLSSLSVEQKCIQYILFVAETQENEAAFKGIYFRSHQNDHEGPYPLSSAVQPHDVGLFSVSIVYFWLTFNSYLQIKYFQLIIWKNNICGSSSYVKIICYFSRSSVEDITQENEIVLPPSPSPAREL